MPLISQLTDYTDKDFDSLRFRLRNLIRSVFPEWTDFNVANFGNILLELFAHTGDVLLFYQDGQARQSRITTATQRKALLGLVKLIGFTPASATAATADLVITLPSPPLGSVTFAKGEFVRTEEITGSVRYQLLANAVITAGANPATVTVSAENSETKNEIFASTGLPNQGVSLGSTPYIDASAVILADNGTYTQVDNFLDSSPTDRHFTVVVDQNDRATIKFGNGVNGASPVGTIVVEYKVGGGAAGRVEQNKLRIFEKTSWTDSLGNTVQPSVTNPSASAGGTDRQSVAQIKERGPASLRVLNRTVAREDFEINARRLTDVARALMLTKNEDGGIAENTGELYIVPVGGGLPSQALKDAVLNQVTVVYPCTLTFDVQVRDPVYKDIDVFAIVYFRAGQNKTAGAAAIRSNLTDFFAVQTAAGTDNTNVDFGANIKDSEGNVTGEVTLSDVFNVIRDTTGIRKIGAAAADFTLNGEHDDVVLSVKEFPKIGTVQIIDGDTGDPY
jgi:hypothetical protein